MEKKLSASIIIDNYNYDQFISEAIDSALHQSYPNVEVIVVDDGSTDSSREIIAGYSDKIIIVLKPNGGQASAFNAGFEKCKGDMIIFLDSDDVLYPDAVKNVIEIFEKNDNVSKVHWQLIVVDGKANKTGTMRPAQLPAEGDFRNRVLEGGPTSCISSPTSGNAWARSFLEKVFPVPEDMSYYRTCADEYLYTLAPVFGLVKTIAEPQGFYRIHGKNIYSALSFDKMLQLELEGHSQQSIALSRILQKHGFNVDQALWLKNSWFHRLKAVIDSINEMIPAEDLFILVDDGTWDIPEYLPGRNVLPFPEEGGKYQGLPENDKLAISELNRLIKKKASYIVFTWAAFWWLTYFTGLQDYLNTNFRCIIKDSAIVVFDLKK